MDFKPVTTLSYTQALNELDSIVRMMQGDTLDIDHLAEYTARAAALLAECRRRLTTTEERLRDTLQGLTQE